MDSNTIQILIAMCVYMAAVIFIGVVFAKRANKDLESYFLGGRTLGPWVAALSAEASDMSGWLLMGLPGVAYWCGLADAAWTAIGLALGTYLNWLLIAKRLRRYSVKSGNSITVPDFFSNRFKENKKVIMSISAFFILIFFAVYAASCLVTFGKLFSALFGASYTSMMIIGAILVLAYTIAGGFLAESASDFMQAVVMIVALVVIMVLGITAVGGFGRLIERAREIPGFFELFGIASPVMADGAQEVSRGTAVFGEAGTYGFLTILSTLSWGLGYFGMPQVLLRFMAIRDDRELKKSRRIGTVWCVISLAAAVLIGITGRVLYPASLLTPGGSESIFILLSKSLLPSLLAGFVMAGILAAAISSSDSYLLIAASAFSKNIFQSLFKKDASDRQLLRLSRLTLLALAVIAVVIALDENSVIFKIVSFAWAGFGATFGPLMIFSLFWRRVNRAGAIAGMISGGGMVFIWKLLIRPLGGVFGIYELLPAFIVSCLFIVVVSLITAEPSKEICEEFDSVKSGAA